MFVVQLQWSILKHKMNSIITQQRIIMNKYISLKVKEIIKIKYSEKVRFYRIDVNFAKK